ncbi:hypothetical protein TIFTF001_021928 [Ficus carica]|uniref:Uncharacterized protein n=1 Tax=Ficus carica TaxID=3494 RepID=A0AA88AT40_FICCA|nr:hypothetical protein TIFTF001_021928 [Ficus carica]
MRTEGGCDSRRGFAGVTFVVESRTGGECDDHRGVEIWCRARQISSWSLDPEEDLAVESQLEKDLTVDQKLERKITGITRKFAG